LDTHYLEKLFLTDQVEWLHLRPCLVPSCCGASRTIRNCWTP